jgi:hypothetical protein
MTSPQKIVFLFEVDNTLIENDRVQDDLKNHLEHETLHIRSSELTS